MTARPFDDPGPGKCPGSIIPARKTAEPEDIAKALLSLDPIIQTNIQTKPCCQHK